MSRHRTDVFSLIAGLLLTGLALVYGVGAYESVHVDGRIVLPAFLVLLGVAGLLGAVIAQRRSDEQSSVAVEAEPAVAESREEHA